MTKDSDVFVDNAETTIYLDESESDTQTEESLAKTDEAGETNEVVAVRENPLQADDEERMVAALETTDLYSEKLEQEKNSTTAEGGSLEPYTGRVESVSYSEEGVVLNVRTWTGTHFTTTLQWPSTGEAEVPEENELVEEHEPMERLLAYTDGGTPRKPDSLLTKSVPVKRDEETGNWTVHLPPVQKGLNKQRFWFSRWFYTNEKVKTVEVVGENELSYHRTYPWQDFIYLIIGQSIILGGAGLEATSGLFSGTFGGVLTALAFFIMAVGGIVAGVSSLSLFARTAIRAFKYAFPKSDS